MKHNAAKPKFAAILQLEGVHEEVIPSVVNALALNGYRSKIFMNEVILQNREDIFAHLPQFDAEYHYVPIKTVQDWKTLENTVKGDPEIDLVFFNTFQRKGGANLAKHIDKPTIGIVHNPSFFNQAHPWVKDMDMSKVSLLTLASHATSEMIKVNPAKYANTGTISPYYWGFPTDIMRLGDFEKRRRLIIPGSVNFANRDYSVVFSAVKNMVKTGLMPIGVICIIGGGPHREKFEKSIIEEGLSDWFDFAPLNAKTGYVTHEDYFKELQRANFILPILPLAKTDYRTYKISASISTAAGYSIPPILDRWTAMAYAIPGIIYDQGDLTSGLKRAMTLTPREYVQLRSEVQDYRTNALKKNGGEINRLINKMSN